MCAGIARRYGVDAALVRLAFVVATAAGGVGIALYLLAWLVIPAGDARRAGAGSRRGRGAVEVALGTGAAAAQRAAHLPRARASGSRTRSSGRWC